MTFFVGVHLIYVVFICAAISTENISDSVPMELNIGEPATTQLAIAAVLISFALRLNIAITGHSLIGLSLGGAEERMEPQLSIYSLYPL